MVNFRSKKAILNKLKNLQALTTSLKGLKTKR